MSHAVTKLLIFSVFNLVFAFGYQIILARQLAPSTYGYLVTVIAISLLVSSLANAGIPGFLLRVFGAEGSLAKRWLKKSYILVSTSIIIVSCVLFIGLWSGESLLILLMFLSLVVGQVLSELVTAKLQIERSYTGLAIWQFLLNAIRTMFFLCCILIGISFSASLAVIGFIISSLTVTLISLWLLLQGVLANTPPKQLDDSIVLGENKFWNIFLQAMPFAASGFFYLIYFQSDIILIKYLLDDEKAGIYNVAFITIAAIYLVPSVIYQKFLLPKLHYWAANDYQKFLHIYQKGSKYMAVLGCGLMLLVLMLAPVIIPLIFGVEFELAGSVLMVLAIGIPFRFIASSLTGLMVERKSMKSKVKIMCFVATVNVALNCLAIPKYGVIGAAATTLISEILLCFLFYRFISKNILDPQNHLNPLVQK